MNIPAWDEKLTTNKAVRANLKLAPYMAVTSKGATSRTWRDSVARGHIFGNPDLLVEALLYREIIRTKHEQTARSAYTKLTSAVGGSALIGCISGYRCVLQITEPGYTLLTNICGVNVRLTKYSTTYTISVEDTYRCSTQSRAVSDTLWDLCGLNRAPAKYKLDKLVSYRELSIGNNTCTKWLTVNCDIVDGELQIGVASGGLLPATRPTKGTSKIVKEALALLTPVVETIVLMEPKCSKVVRGTWNRYDVARHMSGNVKCGMTIDELQEVLVTELRKGIASNDSAVLVPTTAQLSYFVRVIHNLNK
jgi:hypothetical protein